MSVRDAVRNVVHWVLTNCLVAFGRTTPTAAHIVATANARLFPAFAEQLTPTIVIAEPEPEPSVVSTEISPHDLLLEFFCNAFDRNRTKAVDAYLTGGWDCANRLRRSVSRIFPRRRTKIGS